MLAEFLQYLKNLITNTDISDADLYMGKLPNKDEKNIGLYPTEGGQRIEAFGGESTYTYVPFKLLVHWNCSSKDTEKAASVLYDLVEGVKNATTETYYIAFILMDYENPMFIGTDENGVFEYVINGRIYFGR